MNKIVYLFFLTLYTHSNTNCMFWSHSDLNEISSDVFKELHISAPSTQPLKKNTSPSLSAISQEVLSHTLKLRRKTASSQELTKKNNGSSEQKRKTQ